MSQGLPKKQCCETTKTLYDLPNFVISRIMLLLNIHDILAMAKACRRLNTIINRKSVWLPMIKRDCSDITCIELFGSVKQRYLDEMMLRKNKNYTRFPLSDIYKNALLKGNVRIVRAIIACGLEPNETHLLEACQRGHTNVAAVLLNLCVCTDDYLVRCAYVACSKRQEDTFLMLLNAGAPINAKRHQQFRFLYMACRVGSIVMVETLIARGFNVNKKDVYGRTPLFRLCVTECQDYDLKQYNKYGVIVKTRDKTSLEFALLRDRNAVKIAKLLVKAGADLATFDQFGRTIFDYSTKFDSLISLDDLKK